MLTPRANFISRSFSILISLSLSRGVVRKLAAKKLLNPNHTLFLYVDQILSYCSLILFDLISSSNNPPRLYKRDGVRHEELGFV